MLRGAIEFRLYLGAMQMGDQRNRSAVRRQTGTAAPVGTQPSVFSIEDLTDGNHQNLLLDYLSPPVFGAAAVRHSGMTSGRHRPSNLSPTLCTKIV